MQLDHERVRWHRDRLGWTLDTLAEKAEVAKGTVLRAEHGEDVRPSSGRRIARALGTEISDLVPDKPRRVEVLAGTGTGGAPPAGPTVVTPGVGDEPGHVTQPTLEHDYKGPLERRHDAEELANRASEIEAEEGPIFMTSYGDGTPFDEAWEWVGEQVKEARSFYEGKFTLYDNGESIEVFVEHGALSRRA